MELKEIEEQVRRVVTANPVEMTVEYVIELLINTHNAALDKVKKNIRFTKDSEVGLNGYVQIDSQSIDELKIPIK